MKTKILVLSFLLFCMDVNADTKQNQPEVPDIMVEFLDEIESLQPFMVSQKRFSAPENRFNIQTRLNHLAEISLKLKHEKRMVTPFLQVMTEILPLHFQELKEAFNEGHREYSRSMLSATLDGCSSCHSQVKAHKSHLWKFSPETIEGSTFEKAEFLFATRQYDEAYHYYQQVVKDFKPSSIEPINQDVIESLSRKLNILIRSKKDLAEARKEIERDIGKPELPDSMKATLRSNLVSVKNLQNLPIPNLNTSTSKDMEIFVAKVISKTTDFGSAGSRNIVPQLFISGLLYEYAQTHPVKDISPGIYYWLAKCEKKIFKNYFFPLAEFYLKECIDRYPLSPEAKLCFNELENSSYDNIAKKQTLKQ